MLQGVVTAQVRWDMSGRRASQHNGCAVEAHETIVFCLHRRNTSEYTFPSINLLVPSLLTGELIAVQLQHLQLVETPKRLGGGSCRTTSMIEHGINDIFDPS